MNSEARAKALLKQMTIEEKIGQLSMYAVYKLDEQGVPECEGLQEALEKGLVGAVIQGMQDFSSAIYEMQKTIVEKSRLKIPLLFNIDLIHGFDTVMPIPLAASCSFNPKLVEESTKATAIEATSCGVHYTNSPMLDLSRDPRWGRICESQGEDPYLASVMAGAYVRGYQNDERYMMATLKHYAGYGACDGGRDYDTVEICENSMLNAYLLPFKAGVEAGADSVMSAFNTIENVPATGNRKYLKGILRDTFGFNGIILSDAASVLEMVNHGYCEDKKEAARRAMNATLDVEMGTDCYAKELKNLVESGEISESQIDDAVMRVLKKKFDLGLFDDPFKYFKFDKSVRFCEKHLDLSEKLASQSAVLLENNGVLPLPQNKEIALIGECVRSPYMCGVWQASCRQKDTVTLEQGLLSEGFSIVGISETWSIQEIENATFKTDTVIFAVGGNAVEYKGGEAASKSNLSFSAEILKAYDYLISRGKKVIVLVFTSTPHILNAFKRADALVQCWHLGSRSGSAVAKLLSGVYNFSGKLTVTFPRNEGQLPMYYNRKASGRPFKADKQWFRFQTRYLLGENYPQYPFGYGLSYSKFIYENFKLDRETMRRGERVVASVELTNTSDRDGAEIVQLYIKDCVADVVRPMRELKDFARVELKAGEKKRVCFEITEEKLAYYHEDRSFGADKGVFEVFIGADSNASDKQTFSLVD